MQSRILINMRVISCSASSKHLSLPKAVPTSDPPVYFRPIVRGTQATCFSDHFVLDSDANKEKDEVAEVAGRRRRSNTGGRPEERAKNQGAESIFAKRMSSLGHVRLFCSAEIAIGVGDLAKKKLRGYTVFDTGSFGPATPSHTTAKQHISTRLTLGSLKAFPSGSFLTFRITKLGKKSATTTDGSTTPRHPKKLPNLCSRYIVVDRYIHGRLFKLILSNLYSAHFLRKDCVMVTIFSRRKARLKTKLKGTVKEPQNSHREIQWTDTSNLNTTCIKKQMRNS
uniref:Secreted protein n=1 Tax=Steinernema glaseri TaxID=37863 RepID=A0A1I7XX06_9BILA